MSLMRFSFLSTLLTFFITVCLGQNEDALPDMLSDAEFSKLTKMNRSAIAYISEVQKQAEVDDEATSTATALPPDTIDDMISGEDMSPTAFPALSSKAEDSALIPPAFVSATDDDTDDDDNDDNSADITTNSNNLDSESSEVGANQHASINSNTEKAEDNESTNSDTTDSALNDDSSNNNTTLDNTVVLKEPPFVGSYKFLLLVGGVCSFILIIGVIAVIWFKRQDKQFNISGVKNLIASSNKSSLKSILSDDFDPAQSTNTVEMSKLPPNYYEDLNACLTMDAKDNVPATAPKTTSPVDQKTNDSYKAPTIAEL